MAVRAHQGVEVHRGVLALRHFHTCSRGGHGDLRELLDVQLMADARSRRDDAHVLERLLRPLQEVIALAVALELQLHVLLHGARAARHIGDDRVVDDQVAGNLRVDLRRVAAQVRTSFAHHGEVHEHRHAREVLEQHARGAELDLAAHLACATSLNHAFGQIGSRLRALGVAQHVFEQHLQRIRKLLGALNLLKRIIGVSRIAHGKGSGELLVLHIVPSWCVSHPDIDLAEHDSAGNLAHRRKP